MGETFGLAVAEFSAANRPVITSSIHHDDGAARMHLDTLGPDHGLYYHDTPSLLALLRGFDRSAARRNDWNAYRAFEPAKVMATFDKVFIRGRPRKEVPDWKRWRHSGGATSGGDGGGEGRRAHPSSAERVEYQRRHDEMRRVHDELGKLRGLPPQPPTPCDRRYRVLCAEAAVRLEPSTSAATAGTPLLRGATCRVVAVRGAWVRLADDETMQLEVRGLDYAPRQTLPRWMLTSHPEDGTLAEPV